MVTATRAPARPETGEPPPQGSPWLLLASVVLLLVGVGGLVHANTLVCCRASVAAGSPGTDPASGPAGTDPVPEPWGDGVSAAAGPAGTAPVPEPWGDDVLAAAAVSGLPPAVLAAQLDVESRWNPRAVSSAGAMGLAQFIPPTWKRYGRGDPFDPEDAIRAQGSYLKDLRRMMRRLEPASAAEEIDLVLAAYNAGPTTVLRHGGIPPIAETRLYVAQIRELARTKYAGLGG